jgi:hypothetical protein
MLGARTGISSLPSAAPGCVFSASRRLIAWHLTPGRLASDADPNPQLGSFEVREADDHHALVSDHSSSTIARSSLSEGDGSAYLGGGLPGEVA